MACISALAFAAGDAWANYPGADGRIAFDQDDPEDGGRTSDLFSIEPDGTNVLQLTDTPDAEANPSWSADGQQITFTANTSNESWISTMRADGSEQRRVVRLGIDDLGDSLEIAPTFTPSGNRIVYSTLDTIRSIRVDGTDPRLLHRASNGVGRRCCVGGPTVSPDGRLIAFSRNSPAHLDRSGLWTMSPSGKNFRRIVKAREKGAIYDPDFSPDGDQIYFERGTKDLYMRLDGSRPKPIPGMPPGNARASLSPSGEQIVGMQFVSNDLSACADLFTKSLAGVDRSLLTANCTDPQGISSGRPSWQPLPTAGD